MPNPQFFNIDCMDLMPRFGDKEFDLAIVDPPYFLGPERRNYYGSDVSTVGIKRREYGIEEECWKVPGPEYFAELRRVSRHQIVWGINYFDVVLGPGRIVWDKCNLGTSFSDCEIAYCSLHDSVRLFRFMWNGMMQGKSLREGHIQQGNKKLNQKRIHTTEKPIALYHWLLQQYAQPGWRILDTHLGSGSHAIACYDLGYDLVASEKSQTVFKKMLDRYSDYIRKDADKPKLFNNHQPATAHHATR